MYRFTGNCRRWNIAQLWKLFFEHFREDLHILFWNCVSFLLSTHFVSFYFYRSSRFTPKPEPLIQLKNWYRQVGFSCAAQTKSKFWCWITLWRHTYLFTWPYTANVFQGYKRHSPTKVCSSSITFFLFIMLNLHQIWCIFVPNTTKKVVVLYHRIRLLQTRYHKGTDTRMH